MYHNAISVLQAQNNTKDYDQRKLRTRNAPVFAEIALMETMTGWCVALRKRIDRSDGFVGKISYVMIRHYVYHMCLAKSM